jgi:dihydrodipicolinate synthase/N-acetylneuraminate lyase
LTVQARYRGIFPVAPTTFTETDELDLASQKRCIDFMIDAGSDGICILANFSEQFLLSDEEREVLTRTVLEHVAGRVPVMLTTTLAGTTTLRQLTVFSGKLSEETVVVVVGRKSPLMPLPPANVNTPLAAPGTPWSHSAVESFES